MAIKRLKRPRDPIALAKLIGDIATGRQPDGVDDGKSDALISRGRKGGQRGGAARASALSPEQRALIARTAANARWRKKR